jgi:hypothetical protein
VDLQLFEPRRAGQQARAGGGGHLRDTGEQGRGELKLTDCHRSVARSTSACSSLARIHALHCSLKKNPSCQHQHEGLVSGRGAR